MDQAEKLRELARAQRPAPVVNPLKNKRIIAVASGKGGVGKTNFTVNLAIALTRLKQRVMILDADLGMANIDVVCGLSPKYNLGHVIERSKPLRDIVLDCHGGVKVIPGVSGVEELTSLTPDQQKAFFEELGQFDSIDDTDLIIIDIGAGMGHTVINFLLSTNENIVITTSEPTAMMDAYALIKTVFSKNPQANISVVINMVQNKEEALQVYNSMNMITKQFLNTGIEYLGYIASDKVVPKAVKTQKPFLLLQPGSQASKCIEDIAVRVVQAGDTAPQSTVKNFFERMSAFFTG